MKKKLHYKFAWLYSLFIIVVIMLLPISSLAQTNLTVDNQIVSYTSLDNYNVSVTGNSEIHLTGTTSVLTNSQIDLDSEGGWLYFDYVKPSVVLSTYLSQVTVGGVPAVNNTNIRIRNYKMGTLIIPHSPDYQPLEVFDGASFTGSSMKMSTFTFYRSKVIDDDASITFPVVTLDAFNDHISSFKLKRGYMATFAQSPDGTGYSRVFIADKQDLDIAVMPNGLDGEVSFVRVLPWNYPGKKGFTYESGAQQLDCAWFYNWGNGASSTNNVEYVPMKWGGGYAGATFCNKDDATHMLGFNEPSHTEQSNVSVDDAIKYWSSLQKSGLRLGSPGIADNGKPWLYAFMAKADQLNLRIDFVAVHFYKGGYTSAQMYSWLKDVHDKTGRPVWVTEWNNGATWTCCEPTAEEQAIKVQAFTAMMDTTSWIERYAIYNWVGNTRAVILNDALTQAGDVYKAKDSPFAYNSGKEFYMDYSGLTKPYNFSASKEADGVHLSWSENVGGEDGVIIERAINSGSFVEIDRVTGEEISSYIDNSSLVTGSYTYRVKYYNTTESSGYSEEATVNVLPENTMNVALTKPVKVDTYVNTNYTGSGAVDSDNRATNSSRWVSANSTYPHWIEVDLKDTFDISWLSLYTGFDGYNHPISDFELLYWDINSKTWESALSIVGNTNPVYQSPFGEVTTNKVKLYATKADDNYLRLYEIEVYGKPHNKPLPNNVALNKSVQTSSAHSSGKYPGSLAVDGNNDFDNDSRWVSDGSALPEWLEIDLGGSFVIDRMKLVLGDFNNEGPFSGFNFQYWDGSSWVEIFSKTGNTNSTYEQTFDAVTTTMVKLNVTAGPTTVRLHEIEVYGYEEGATGINDERDDGEYIIFPNPVGNELNISGLKSIETINIYDLSGRLALVKETAGKINIDQLDKGVYFLKIDSEHVIQFVKK